jgi:hypothetical protein
MGPDLVLLTDVGFKAYPLSLLAVLVLPVHAGFCATLPRHYAHSLRLRTTGQVGKGDKKLTSLHDLVSIKISCLNTLSVGSKNHGDHHQVDTLYSCSSISQGGSTLKLSMS